MDNPLRLSRQEIVELLRPLTTKAELDELLQEDTATIRGAYTALVSPESDKVAPFIPPHVCDIRCNNRLILSIDTATLGNIKVSGNAGGGKGKDNSFRLYP